MALPPDDRAEAAFWAAFIRNRNVGVGTAEDGAIAVAGGYALYAAGKQGNVALAIGSTRALRDDDLAAIEAFYERRLVVPSIEVRTDVAERDRALIGAHGYSEGEQDFALYESTVLLERTGEAVHARQTNDRAAWVRVVTHAFADGGEPDASTVRGAETCASAASALFVVDIDGVPAGAGAVGIAGEVAYLFCGAVLPQFRRAGVHRELMRARASFGAAHGTSRTMLKTVVGSPAEAAAQRAGFERTTTLRRLRRRDAMARGAGQP